MRPEILAWLSCPKCGSDLTCPHRDADVLSGEVSCGGCRAKYPILAGVLVLVSDVGAYLLSHAKGISRYVELGEIPKKYRSDFAAALEELESEHIEEDLEAERVTSLYLMTHYLSAKDVRLSSPVLRDVIAKHWDHGPFARIKEMLAKRSAKGGMLELGCGVGGLFSALRPHLKSYLGLDSSFASISLARHFALGAKINKKNFIPDDLLFGAVAREVNIQLPKQMPEAADFIVCDLASPPVKEDSWDLSAALNVLDMLPNPIDLPRLQNRVLRKDGIAIQSCPYIWHPEVAKALRAEMPKSVRSSAEAAEELYRRSGFQIDSVESEVPWIFYKNNRQLEIYSVHLFCASKVTSI